MTNKDINRYPKPSWATHQVVRIGGLVEDVCPHNCGHPNAEYLRIHDPDGSKMLGIHCCDSCCCKGDD